VETGRWLAARNAGVLLPDPPQEALRSFFSTLDADGYARLAGATASIPRGDLVDDAESCRALVQSLPVQRRLPAKSLKRLETTLSGSA
jgi:hypothetical protein